MQKRQKVIWLDPVKYELFLGSGGEIYFEYSINFRDTTVSYTLARNLSTADMDVHVSHTLHLLYLTQVFRLVFYNDVESLTRLA